VEYFYFLLGPLRACLGFGTLRATLAHGKCRKRWPILLLPRVIVLRIRNKIQEIWSLIFKCGCLVPLVMNSSQELSLILVQCGVNTHLESKEADNLMLMVFHLAIGLYNALHHHRNHINNTCQVLGYCQEKQCFCVQSWTALEGITRAWHTHIRWHRVRCTRCMHNGMFCHYINIKISANIVE
jgi:hypothetical protein